MLEAASTDTNNVNVNVDIGKFLERDERIIILGSGLAALSLFLQAIYFPLIKRTATVPQAFSIISIEITEPGVVISVFLLFGAVFLMGYFFNCLRVLFFEEILNMFYPIDFVLPKTIDEIKSFHEYEEKHLRPFLLLRMTSGNLSLILCSYSIYSSFFYLYSSLWFVPVLALFMSILMFFCLFFVKKAQLNLTGFYLNRQATEKNNLSSKIF